MMTTEQEQIHNLETMIAAVLMGEEQPSLSRVSELVDLYRSLPLFISISEEDAQQLAWRIKERFSVVRTCGNIIGTPVELWLPQVQSKSDFDPYYWERHREFLMSGKFSNPELINVQEQDAERILERLGNPHESGTWNRSGLVFGYGQSGKTENYTALICKAADAGYKVIIVIAGIHNSLRNQTQMRIDQGFIGIDSATVGRRDGYIAVGVGRHSENRFPISFTTTQRDFNRPTANSLGISLDRLNEPVVFVIKKNASTLRYLIDWLKYHNVNRNIAQIPSPLLLIDDGAEAPAINIGPIRSKIRNLTSELPNLFSRISYVGYTSAPFSGVDRNDERDYGILEHSLFPLDFIYRLNAPSSYFGPRQVFLEEESSKRIVRFVEDNDHLLPIKHKRGHQVTELPESLVNAIRAFVVAIAIRISRGHSGEHNSMQVKVSRFAQVQTQIKDHINHKLTDIQECIRVHSKFPEDKALENSEMRALYDIWSDQYPSSGTEWEEVQSNLHEAAEHILVMELNSRVINQPNHQDLKDDGLKKIIVGGVPGLTLEGLIVSYFLSSQTRTDTQMKSCSWFGYRAGYEDLFRIWMPLEAFERYSSLSEVNEQLSNELALIETNGGTLKEFESKISNHPYKPTSAGWDRF